MYRRVERHAAAMRLKNAESLRTRRFRAISRELAAGRLKRCRRSAAEGGVLGGPGAGQKGTEEADGMTNAKLNGDGDMFVGAACPACKEQRVHTDEEWKHHPLHGHGLGGDGKYTHPDLIHPDPIRECAK